MKPNRNSWLDTVNPIRGLSISAAKSIFDSARKNGSALLQKIYAEIEDCDPTLMTCVDRRAAAIAGIGWQVNARASAKDQGLADAQRQAVDAFLSGIENFEDALEHLDLAFFRGFSHVQPVWEADNTVRRINLLDSWNFLQEKHTGKWFYNPEASTDLTGCEEVTPEARLVTLTHRRPIDWPALIVYIRKSLAEQDWGRYVERYGLPNFIATMHAGATDAQRDEYLKTAKAVREGQPAALPNGGSVTTVGTESRGQDPFSLFLEHQEKQIVLMATGGTLTSLAQADTGSLAGGAQMDVWRQIVARDVTVISSAINRALVRPFLEAAFPGKPIAADFKIEAVEKPGKKETADLAVALRNAGYTIDQGELEEAVGFKLEKDAAPQPAPGGMLLNKEPAAPAKPVLRSHGEGGKPGKDLADTLQDALEAAMVEAIAGELKKPELANKKDDNGQEHDDKGLFTGDGQGGGGSEDDEEKKKAEEAKAKRAANHANGKTAWADAVSNKRDVVNAMQRDSVGGIDFEYGFPGTEAKGYHDGYGVSHVLVNHSKEAPMIPGVLAYGDVLENTSEGKYYVIKKRNIVVLKKKPGRNSCLITGFVKDNPHKVKEIRDRCKLIEKGEE